MSIERTQQDTIINRPSPAPQPGGAVQKFRKLVHTAIMGTALCVGPSANLGCTTLRSYQAATTGYTAMDEMSDPVMIDGELLPSISEMQKILHHALGDKYYHDSLFSNSQIQATPNENPSHLPEIEGFEQINLPPEEIVTYLRKTLPDDWYQYINYMGINHEDSDNKYPGLDKEESFGNFQNRDTRKVNFTYRQFWQDKSIQTGNIDFLFHAIDHEITHSMDFEANPHLTTPKRLVLMYLIFRMIQDAGRPKFTYPESIKAETPSDKYKETYLKMREFMAELVATSLKKCHGSTSEQWVESCEKMYRSKYKASPLMAKRAAQLLQLHLRWTAPTFHPEKVTAIKQAIIDHASTEHQARRAHKILEAVPDQNLRNLLLEALNVDQTLTRQDLGYQSSILGVLAFVEFRRDPDFKKCEPIQIDLPNSKANASELQAALQHIINQIFNIRANRLGIKQRDGSSFKVELGTVDQKSGPSTFKLLMEEYSKLSPQEKNEFLKIARTKLAVLNLHEREPRRSVTTTSSQFDQ